MKTLSTLLKLLVFVVLFLLPFGGRWYWYYRGKYETPKIAPIDRRGYPHQQRNTTPMSINLNQAAGAL